MKRNYVTPQMDPIALSDADVIRTSLELETDEQGNPWTPWV